MKAARHFESAAIPKVDMTASVQINSEDFGTLAIGAVRYAAGRHTYFPGMVEDVILPRLFALGDNDLSVIRKELTDPKRGDGGMGRLKEAVEREIGRRAKR